jgi:hypothetical protein
MLDNGGVFTPSILPHAGFPDSGSRSPSSEHHIEDGPGLVHQRCHVGVGPFTRH